MGHLGGTTFLPASALDVTPRLGLAPVLARAYNTKLLQSFREILVRLPELSSDIRSTIIEGLENINPSYKQNPSLYRLYFQCRDATEDARLAAPISELLHFLSHTHPPDFSIERLTRADWLLRDVICPIESNAVGGNLAFNELPQDAFPSEASRLRSAWDLIAALDPAMGEELMTFVTNVYLFRGRTVVGLTSPRFHGAMFLSAAPGSDDPTYYVEHLVHEGSHMRLNTLIAFDPLVRNGDVAAFQAPIRQDKRPMLGVLHATFVLFRIVRVLSHCAEHAGASEHDQWIAAAATAHARFEKGLRVVKEHADLTDWGRRLVSSMHA